MMKLMMTDRSRGVDESCDSEPTCPCCADMVLQLFQFLSPPSAELSPDIFNWVKVGNLQPICFETTVGTCDFLNCSCYHYLKKHQVKGGKSAAPLL